MPHLVKESGLTVHLIAKLQSQEPAQNARNSNPQQNIHNNQNNVPPHIPPPIPPMPFLNPLQGLFGNMNLSQDQSIANTINNALGSLMGNIRVVPNPQNINQPQPQQQQHQQPPSQQPQQNQQNQPPQNQPRAHVHIVVNSNPLNQLQSNISRLNLPEEPLLTNQSDGR